MAVVLFAEDEKWSVEAYMSRLQADGHIVRYASNVQQARKVLASQKVDTMVLDIMMPFEPLEDLLKKGIEAVRNAPKRDVWAGVELYRTARQQFPNLKVVVLSVLSEGDIRN